MHRFGSWDWTYSLGTYNLHNRKNETRLPVWLGRFLHEQASLTSSTTTTIKARNAGVQSGLLLDAAWTKSAGVAKFHVKSSTRVLAFLQLHIKHHNAIMVRKLSSGNSEASLSSQRGQACQLLLLSDHVSSSTERRFLCAMDKMAVSASPFSSKWQTIWYARQLNWRSTKITNN